LTANVTAAVMPQIVYSDLFALGNCPQCMNSVPFNTIVPVLLRIVVAGMVDATGFEEHPAASPVGLDGEAVRSKNTEDLLGLVIVWINIVQREERLFLVMIEGIDLLR
jgi:hypothetical protein